MTEYRTIAAPASAEFTEKRSRFIGHIKPVQTADEATAFINEVKSRHWDATHNVYAYVLREGQTRRYSDDGEPQGTAGIPALDVLLKEELTDCAVVVTRYFGGVMLGAGGLVRAYSKGSKLAADAGGIVTMGLCLIVKVMSDYAFYGRLATLVPEMGGVILDTEFAGNVTVAFRMPKKLTGAFEERLVDLSLGKCGIEVERETFAAV
ncbi:MAG: YigZ family protein [Oscillospiraceae bacterium]|nr:YigZ family protein [Oscillospiraceae bacterium]